MSTRPPKHRGWRRREIDLAKIGVLMRAAGFLGCDDDPIAGHGLYDRAGRLRRIHATYENGWRATFVQRLDGGHALSQAIRMITRIAAP